MLTINTFPGDTIEYIVDRMIKLARVDNHPVCTTFNDIVVVVNADSNADEVVSKFQSTVDERYKAWLNSPEGIVASEAANTRKVTLQKKCDGLLLQLNTMNFGDDVTVLNWLCQLADCADHVDVDSKPDIVLAKFEREGYHANVNCGKDFNGEDRDNFMRYIVGQALSGIATVGSPHGVIHRFTAEWCEKFVA